MQEGNNGQRGCCSVCGTAEDNPIHKANICGKPFGKEILLPGILPGRGFRKVCERFVGHDGKCGLSPLGEGPHSFLSYGDACNGLEV